MLSEQSFERAVAGGGALIYKLYHFESQTTCLMFFFLPMKQCVFNQNKNFNHREKKIRKKFILRWIKRMKLTQRIIKKQPQALIDVKERRKENLITITISYFY